jgi:hypothetical protein
MFLGTYPSIQVKGRRWKFSAYQVVHQFDGNEQVLILGKYEMKKR